MSPKPNPPLVFIDVQVPARTIAMRWKFSTILALQPSLNERPFGFNRISTVASLVNQLSFAVVDQLVFQLVPLHLAPIFIP